MDTAQIIALGKTDESRPLVVGQDVFEKDLATNHLYRFSRKRYIFLNLLHDDIPLEEAALKSGIDVETALRFRDSSEACAYLEMRELREVVAREAKDQDKWWVDGYMAENGKKSMNKVQAEIWKERGKRIQPCSEANQPEMKVEIHISPDALERSKERRKSVETQIVEELKHAV